jgi:predicted amidohydrolase
MLSELSRLLNITIVGGSIPERSGDRLYNTCCVFGTDGKLKAKHRKVLFVLWLYCFHVLCIVVEDGTLF